MFAILTWQCTRDPFYTSWKILASYFVHADISRSPLAGSRPRHRVRTPKTFLYIPTSKTVVPPFYSATKRYWLQYGIPHPLPLDSNFEKNVFPRFCASYTFINCTLVLVSIKFIVMIALPCIVISKCPQSAVTHSISVFLRVFYT